MIIEYAPLRGIIFNGVALPFKSKRILNRAKLNIKYEEDNLEIN